MLDVYVKEFMEIATYVFKDENTIRKKEYWSTEKRKRGSQSVWKYTKDSESWWISNKKDPFFYFNKNVHSLATGTKGIEPNSCTHR